jgi:hypothetical protein
MDQKLSADERAAGLTFAVDCAGVRAFCGVMRRLEDP